MLICRFHILWYCEHKICPLHPHNMYLHCLKYFQLHCILILFVVFVCLYVCMFVSLCVLYVCMCLYVFVFQRFSFLRLKTPRKNCTCRTHFQNKKTAAFSSFFFCVMAFFSVVPWKLYQTQSHTPHTHFKKKKKKIKKKSMVNKKRKTCVFFVFCFCFCVCKNIITRHVSFDQWFYFFG